jgi:hypothetical protein
MFYGLWDGLAKKCLQLNPKFRLTGPARWKRWLSPASGTTPLIVLFQDGLRLIDELGPEFAANAPGEAALPRSASREGDGKLGRDFGVVSNDLHTAI